MELLRAADIDGLENLVTSEPRTIRHLLGRLWDDDEQKRSLAARALGAAAVAHPEQARDLARRLLWALNDESGMNGASGLAALGEMAARAPELMAPFVAPMASYLWDEGLRSEILYALRRMAQADRALVEPVWPLLEGVFESFDAGDRRLAEEILRDAGGVHEN